jgi:alpha-D-ribose 1-methylphosphonate 5-triphosphate synthase subunit PhnH
LRRGRKEDGVGDSRQLAEFEDAVHDAGGAVATLLAAMAHPGRIETVPRVGALPVPLSPAAFAVLLTLTDFDTPLWLGGGLARLDVKAYLDEHCGSPSTNVAEAARFLVCDDHALLPSLTSLLQGTPEQPDRSATVVLQLPQFAAGGAPVRLTGAGIDAALDLSLAGLDHGFWREAQGNSEQYPLGVDFVFCAGTQLLALPRSTRIDLVEGG